MIKLKDLLSESKYDTAARKIASDTITQLKQFKSDAESNTQQFLQDFKDQGGFAETYETKQYQIGNKQLQADILIEVLSPSVYSRGEIGSPRNKKAIAKGYSIKGSASNTSMNIKIHLTLTYPTFTNLQQLYSEIYQDALGVARHEIEHLLQTVSKISGRETDLSRNIDTSLSTRKQNAGYRKLPTELEADAKAINLLAKKKRIEYEQAAQEYYSRIPQVDKREVGALVKAVVDYSKKFRN